MSFISNIIRGGLTSIEMLNGGLQTIVLNWASISWVLQSEIPIPIKIPLHSPFNRKHPVTLNYTYVSNLDITFRIFSLYSYTNLFHVFRLFDAKDKCFRDLKTSLHGLKLQHLGNAMVEAGQECISTIQSQEVSFSNQKNVLLAILNILDF